MNPARLPLTDVRQCRGCARDQSVTRVEWEAGKEGQEGLVEKLSSYARVATGCVFMLITTIIQVLVLIVLLPSRTARIKACNFYGSVAGAGIVWISGSSLNVRGVENLDRKRPAIYISNHASPLDIFIAMWKSPVGTVGVAKKSVIFYPFIGQVYALSGHLRIDRGRTGRAVEGMQRLGELVRANKLSIFIWPEGTRSRSGRLLPFKKGVVHLALQTGLPIVPFILEGAHKCWEPHSLLIKGVPITLDVLPAIDTSGWSLETIEQHVADLQALFVDHLPEDQKPLAEAA